jgi:hypothetical protein
MIVEILQEYSGIALGMAVAAMGLAMYFDGTKK